MTGMRRAEALGVKWEDVDLEAGRVALRRKNRKRHRARALTESEACGPSRPLSCSLLPHRELGRPDLALRVAGDVGGVDLERVLPPARVQRQEYFVLALVAQVPALSVFLSFLPW